MNNNILKKMKVGHGDDTFYRKVINEFAEKKQRIQVIYKYILNISWFVDFNIFSYFSHN